MKKIFLGVLLSAIVGAALASECKYNELIGNVGDFKIDTNLFHVVQQVAAALAPLSKEQVEALFQEVKPKLASVKIFLAELGMAAAPISFFKQLEARAEQMFALIEINAQNQRVTDNDCIAKTGVRFVAEKLSRVFAFEGPTDGQLYIVLSAVLLGRVPAVRSWIVKNAKSLETGINKKTGGPMQLGAALLALFMEDKELFEVLIANRVKLGANGFNRYFFLIFRMLETAKGKKEPEKTKKVYIPSYNYIADTLKNPGSPKAKEFIEKLRAYTPEQKQILLLQRPELGRFLK